MSGKNIKLKHFIFFVIFNCISLSLLVGFTSNFFAIDLLFLGIFITISVSIWKQMNDPPNIGISSYIVFSYMFFYIAPLIQIHLFEGHRGLFPNTLPFSYNLALQALGSILLFNIVFLISFRRFLHKNHFSNMHEANNNTEQKKYSFTALIMLVASFCAIPLLSLVFGDNVELPQDSKAKDLILTKLIFFFPLFPALYYAKYKNKATLILCIFTIVLLILFKNPFFEKRNALGPIYLTLLTIYVPSIFRSNFRSLLLLFSILLIFYPIITVITHNRDISFEQFSSLTVGDYLDLISGAFTTLHYDAFSNVMAAILYYHEHDIVYGKQLLGSVLFFIPRMFWDDKPWGSGMEIGDYLIGNFFMWFNNLSMPLVGEGWMNFGIIGVVVFAIILAYLVEMFGRWMRSGDFTKHIAAVYFSYHLIFLLRGDLMNGIAYFVGPFIAMYIIPKFISNKKIKNN